MSGSEPMVQAQTPLDLESVVLRLIGEAGEARSLVFEALSQALAGDYASARATILRAEEHIRAAHQVQFQELIAREARGEHVPITLLVIHGMDLLMTTASEHDVACALIENQAAGKASPHGT